ncbi:MAG: STM4012 family radical SAM protein [Planctomycetales bacterium]
MIELSQSGFPTDIAGNQGETNQPLPLVDQRSRDQVGSAVELAAYAYSYPHKSSYRPLVPPVRLREAWRLEPRNRLALYLHIPFCEMRCGFCNLFTQSQPADDLVTAYLGALSLQSRAVQQELGPVTIRQFAVGGGTPTILSAEQLASLLGSVERSFGFSIAEVPTSVEVSPATATNDKLAALKALGVERISLGIQSFRDEELGRLGRPQRMEDVHRALQAIRELEFSVLNIDLIYGEADQTVTGWLNSLEAALDYTPEEIYLYPLYVRPETGLGRLRRTAPLRTDLYRAGRDMLLSRGYRQTSLRCFLRSSPGRPVQYACQQDGMIGLGCGARSYTQRLHYSTRFAVTQAGIQTILADWIGQSEADFGWATHGVWLSTDERRRRFLILGLLQSEGLALDEYVDRFGVAPIGEFPELQNLMDRGWTVQLPGRLRLTESGLEHSDLVGPLLYSSMVRDSLREFVSR